MDGGAEAPSGSDVRASKCVRTGHVGVGDPDSTMRDLADQIGTSDVSLVVLFVSPSADIDAIARIAGDLFGDTPVIGCSTAGEISSLGYTEDEIVAIAFPSRDFEVATLFIDNLTDFPEQEVKARAGRMRGAMARQNPALPAEFAYIMIDGLSLCEDQLMAALGVALGPIPMFGGSAGDGLDFGQTFVIHDGHAHSNAAILALVRTRCRIEVFKFEHLNPTDQKMVVTGADPKRRIVREINAEPAAREYARMVGLDPEDLSPLIFAAHPVVVKIGGQHHVRACQMVMENGDLRFFSAIDEGLVLTLAEPDDITEHLSRSLATLSVKEQPDAILACDCILRRIESQQRQELTRMSKVLSDNRVVGFSTYGEQRGAVHVNHTITGVAIYPPPGGEDT